MSKKATGIRVVRPWCNGWERWELIRRRPRRPFPGAGRGREGDVFAVPARQVVAVPLWLDSEDSAVLDAAVLLEMEVRGFASEGVLPDASVRKIARENGRSLVVVAVFPSDFEKRYPDVVAQRYEVSAALLPLDEDALTVWREGGEYVAAYTRGRDLVHWSTWDAAATGREIQTWLRTTTLSLLASGVITRRPQHIVVDDGLSVSDLGFDFIPVVRPLGRPWWTRRPADGVPPPPLRPSAARRAAPVSAGSASRSRWLTGSWFLLPEAIWDGSRSSRHASPPRSTRSRPRRRRFSP